MDNTTLITGKKYIKDIFSQEQFFNIPEYQRPYVWDNLEINKLLEDLKSSFKHNKENKYYVGNTYVIKSNNEKQIKILLQTKK